MKYAICLYGLHPKYCDKGYKISKDRSYVYWKKNVFDINNVDIFLHSWSINDYDQLLNEYNPTKYIIEKQINFKNKDKIKSQSEENTLIKYYGIGWEQIQYSSTYSMKKSIDLMKKYEEDNKIKYNMVMLARMDLIWLIKFKFNELDNQKFYVPIWGKNNIHSINNNYSSVLGNIFISNSNNIIKFSSLYDNLNNYINKQISMHTIFKTHIDTITNNIEYKFRDKSFKPECDKQRYLIKLI